MTLPVLRIEEGVLVGEVPVFLEDNTWGLSEADLVELDAMGAGVPSDDFDDAEFGGDGSGPKPGVQSPWYGRGSKKKPVAKKGRKGVRIPTHARTPDGQEADPGQFGRAMESLFIAHGSGQAAKLLGVDGVSRVSGGGGMTTTPIDVVLGDASERGGHFSAECKSQHVDKLEYKTSIGQKALDAKMAAASKSGGIPLTILQIVDQDNGKVHVHLFDAEFRSVRVGRKGGTRNRVPDFSYRFTKEAFRTAYNDAGAREE